MAKGKPEDAAMGGMFRSIPTRNSRAAVGNTNSTLDLKSFGAGTVDLRGKWVWFTAVGGDVTMRRFDDAAAFGDAVPTLTAGTGFTIKNGQTYELFIDADGRTKIRVIGNVACNLDADYDHE